MVCAGFYGLFFEFLHEDVRYNGAQGASHGYAFNLFIEYLVPLKVAGGQAILLVGSWFSILYVWGSSNLKLKNSNSHLERGNSGRPTTGHRPLNVVERIRKQTPRM